MTRRTVAQHSLGLLPAADDPAPTKATGRPVLAEDLVLLAELQERVMRAEREVAVSPDGAAERVRVAALQAALVRAVDAVRNRGFAARD